MKFQTSKLLTLGLSVAALWLPPGKTLAQTEAGQGGHSIRAEIHGGSATPAGLSEVDARAIANNATAPEAAIPSLGVVPLDGDLYRIDGIAGGAMLSRMEMAPSRGASVRADGETTDHLVTGAGNRWAYATRGESQITLASLRDASARSATPLDAGFPVGALAMSGDGLLLAVATESGAAVKLFSLENGALRENRTVEFGAAAGSIRSLQISHSGAAIAVVRTGTGWTEALLWSAETNSAVVVANGASLFAAIRPDGRQAAVFDLEASTLRVFDRGAGGFSLATSTSLPLGPAGGSRVLAALHFAGGRFTATRIRDRQVTMCQESGECQTSTLPMPAARVVRSVSSPDVLFVESARQGVPSYLVELENGQANWHFVSRPTESRSPNEGRRPAGGIVEPVR